MCRVPFAFLLSMAKLKYKQYLTADQNGQWELFKTQWDDAQAFEHGVHWGGVFAESMQGVLHRFLDGESDAFSKFVK